jgi:hypothetical protein
MKPRHDPALETKILTELVAKVKIAQRIPTSVLLYLCEQAVDPMPRLIRGGLRLERDFLNICLGVPSRLVSGFLDFRFKLPRWWRAFRVHELTGLPLEMLLRVK